MAPSLTRRRQEEELRRIALYEATLRRVFSAPRPAPDFENALSEARAGLFEAVVRPSHAWRPKMKTRDPGRLRLAAARHLFARYPVAGHLEAIWLDVDGLSAEEVQLRKRWYVAVARGDSLYRAGASQWLSRKEVHAFLTAPPGLSFEQAFWHAIASGMTDDAAAALRIARSRIARTARPDFAFWREVARFFCAHPTTVEEIDDLSDYVAAARGRDRRFSLKGRTLASLRRLSAAWHRDVAAVARIEAMRLRVAGPAAARDSRWAGSPVADWSWQPPGHEAKARREEYVVVQLNTADELVSESRAMHHCVWTYAEKCIAGSASIWSLRRKRGRDTSRLLTIELDRSGRAVQVRGFGNRLASTDEAKVLERWARARNVTL